MFPVGWLMIFLLWGFFMIVCKPEKATIPGLRERAKNLYARLGPIVQAGDPDPGHRRRRHRHHEPAVLHPRPGAGLDKSAIILRATILFFLFRILTIKDLEEIPWNIILLFGGAMSIGFCLWQTGAAQVAGRPVAGACSRTRPGSCSSWASRSSCW